MAENIIESHVQGQQRENGSNIYIDFLDAVRNGTEEDVRKCLLPLSSDDTGKRAAIAEEEDGDDLSHKQKLLEALENKDVGAVWKLIAEAKGSDVKTLETLNETCQSVAAHERLKEGGLIKCLWGKIKSQIRCAGGSGSKCREDKQKQTEFQHEEEQQWIKILCNPLYIGLEWLWRNNPENRIKTPSTSQQTKRKESKFEDVIEAALDDAYLLEKIALYEHHYSRDEYTRRALECEIFAADVVEGSNLGQLHEIMDIMGNGCLLLEKPKDFNQSLSLLKLAADKERKRFVSSPKCQSILNEIIYYEWPYWQNMSRITKLLWFFLQLVFVAVSSIFYIPIRLARKFPCCNKDDNIWWEFRDLYEHPYSKFINHTMWYLGFLFFIFLTSFEHDFRTTVAGLRHIDYVVLSFVLGLLLQEFLEALRQGFYIYMSKWWNVVDTLIIVTFLAAYAVWLLSWKHYGKWKPKEAAFVVADVLYASATVIAYFHLTHIFQVDSVLGPLQLSLYKMLKDLGRFLVIFLLLYISFVNGVVKVYSYYVASQIELRRQNITQYEESHSYANHADALIGLFWLLLGVVEEDKISVKDPAFALTATFGRLFLMVYVVCTVIVALNMLIAMMNNSFERIMENADIEWKFSRARMWLEWIDKGNTMPAPINIIYYILYLLVVRLCGKLFGICKEKCPCCQGNKDEVEGQAIRERDEAMNRKEKRKETMKDLVVKYLKDRYFGKREIEYNNETRENNDATSKRGKHQMNIDDNINLLKRLVDRQTKELAELNKKIDSMVK